MTDPVSHDTTRPPRCANKACSKPFIRNGGSHQRRCPTCQKEYEAKRRNDRYYDPKPDAGSECWGCVFLEDCRYKVRVGQAPYCWAENRMSYLYVKRYQAGGEGNGGRALIARQLATVLERRVG